ncbi:unnamed protein product, partial [Iphiclides podalirius]
MNVLEVLIKASERAACIARSCADSSDETLLVTEKGENEANARFNKDFKTIADVLAQESAKAEIATCLPNLAKHIRGEERNEINGIKICLQDSSEKTAELISSLVPLSTAKCLAQAAHSEVNYELTNNLPNILLDPNDLGVWIDPIDATAEFIAGVKGEGDPKHGLVCVSVLVGAYLRSSGEPVVGVINQPFYNGNKGRVVWGVSYDGVSKWSHDNKEVGSGENVVLISGAEKPDIVEKLKNSGWEVTSVPGAGHKLLKVALGEAAAYVVSGSTTFRWDTCAPNAILNAKGGGLVAFSTHNSITYNDTEGLDAKEYCNSEGIIAYGSKSTMLKILNVLN